MAKGEQQALKTLGSRIKALRDGSSGNAPVQRVPLFNKDEALNKGSFRAPLRSGFTLIELLVVVLIIGILAAVALPQYQKAVDKARAAGAIHMLTQIAKAESLHYLEYGEFTQSLHDLDIGIPGIKSDPLQPHIANSNDFVFTIVQIATSGDFVQVWASASDSAGNLLQGDNEYHLDFTIYADGTVKRRCLHGNTLNGGKCQFIATGDEWTKTK